MAQVESKNQRMDLVDHVPWSDRRAQFLDSLADRLSTLKMEGKSLSDKELLGCSHKQVENLFGLQEFSHRVQTDIVVELAYMRSDAFKQRAWQSLGINSERELASLSPEKQEELQEVHDKIIALGRNAYMDVVIETTDNPMDSAYMTPDDMSEESPMVQIFHGKKHASKVFQELNIAAHELSHHLYHSDIYDGISPGIHEDAGEYAYGLEDSPYSRINKDNLIPSRFIGLLYTLQFSPEGIRAMKEGGVSKEERKELSDILKNLKPDELKDHPDVTEHDNQGVERAADVHGARMQLLKDGIWNPFSGQPLTMKEIEAFRKRHPDSRIFEYWNNEKAVYFLNNIAEVPKAAQISDLQMGGMEDPLQGIDLANLRKQVNETMQSEGLGTSHMQGEILQTTEKSEQAQRFDLKKAQSLAAMNFDAMEGVQVEVTETVVSGIKI